MFIDSGGLRSSPVVEALLTCRRFFVHAALFSALINILYLAPTLYMLQVYDRVLPTRGVATLAALSLALCAAIGTIACLDFVRSRILIRAGAKIERQMGEPILNQLAILSAKSGVAPTSGILRHFDNLRYALTGNVALAIFDAPWAPIYIIACFLLHPALGALALCGCLSLTLLTWLNERATNARIQAAGQGARSAYNGIERFLMGGTAFGPLGMNGTLVHRHVGIRSAASQLAVSASLASAVYLAIIKATRLLLQSLALGLAAYLAINQAISPGAIFAASLLIARALAPLELFAGAWRGFAQSRSAYLALRDFFDGPPRLDERLWLPTPTGKIDVENVAVASPSDSKTILRNVSFSLQGGAMLGIVGASGAGKSTLGRILVGAFPLSSGCIRIDGANLQDWPEQQLASMFGYAPQQPHLHEGTIRENISRFRRDIPKESIDAEVVRVSRLCGAHEMILKMPRGYDTIVGWGGAGLSVGQAQRLSLARALFSRPPIIVLDEPNANLDAESEACLMAAVGELRREQVTIIVIAHHGKILSMADHILVMQNGEVSLCGPRENILANLRGPSNRRAVANAC